MKRITLFYIILILCGKIHADEKVDELILLGNFHFAAGEIEDALELYNRAVELDTYYFRTYYSRGFVYMYMKNKEKALYDFNEARILNRYMDFVLTQ